MYDFLCYNNNNSNSDNNKININMNYTKMRLGAACVMELHVVPSVSLRSCQSQKLMRVVLPGKTKKCLNTHSSRQK